MTGKRKRYGAEFKARVALEALRGELTAAQLAAKHGVHQRVSNTMDVEFCLEALEEALARFGRPGIFNTDQGSQFTSSRFTGALLAAGVRVSMDGRGRWMDCESIGVVRRA